MKQCLEYFSDKDWARVNGNYVSFFSDRGDWFIKIMRYFFNDVGYTLSYLNSPMGEIITAHLTE